MTCIYRVTINGPDQENRYRITWFNHDTGEMDYFDVAAEISREEMTTLWRYPDYRLEIGRKLFRFLDGDAGLPLFL